MAQKLMNDSWGHPEGPPAYESILSVEEFEQKATSVAEESARNDSGPAERGKQRASEFSEFEDWDDAKFEAAAAAYRARQAAKQQQQQQQQQRQETWPRDEKQSASTSSSYYTSSTSSYHEQSSPTASSSSVYVAHGQHAFSGGLRDNSTQALPGQLPVMGSDDSSNSRGLPQRPIDRPDQTGPASSPPPTSPTGNFQSPPSFTDHMTTYVDSGLDGARERESTEVLPDLTPPSTTPSPPQSRQMRPISEIPNVQAPPSQQSYHNMPPPPLPFRQITHRHSENPSSMMNPRSEAPPAPQRRSEIPLSSHHAEPPPVFQEGKTPIVPSIEKKILYGEPYSRARELYASATKMGGPMVSIDFKKVGFNNNQAPARVEEEPVPSHSSFYSNSVSSYFDKRPLPQPKRQSTAVPPSQQYGQPFSYAPPSNDPGMPMYGNPNPSAFYGPASPTYPVHQQQQHQAPVHTGYYGQPSQQTPQLHQPQPGGYPAGTYQSNLHYPPAPQHPSAAQNYWPANSNGWSPYGR
ncbi:hypothetical protein FRC17_001963 [Serendipita sp. 399]|nr:hypothetical protein FRC17_001963 [Serendipita sp. 399]